MTKQHLSTVNIPRRGRPVKWNLDLSDFHCPFCGSLSLKVHSRYGKVEPRFRLRCLDCKRTFSERKGTPLYWAKKPSKAVAQMVQALCDGNGIRGASRVCGVNRATIALCLRKAGHHADAVASRLSRNVKLSEVQVDEAHATVFKKEKNLSTKDRCLHPDAGTAWLFTAIDAPTKFIPLAGVAENMGREAIECFFKGLAKRLNKPWPLFATDMWNAHAEAVAASLRGDPQGLRYVQARGHLSEYEGNYAPPTPHSKIIFGDKDKIDRHYQRSKASNRINTAFIEVFHKTLRTANRRLQRRANGVSKKRHQLSLQLALYTTWYNFCKEHRTLRVKNGHHGNGRKWDVRTPAMAAKIADHRWTVEELLKVIA